MTKYVGFQARNRATYHGPPWPQSVAEVPVTDAEVAAWRERWGATCSDKVARLLTTLERDYAAITGTAPARSGAPAV